MQIEVIMPEIKEPVKQYCPECEYDYTLFSDPDQPQCDECSAWEISSKKRVKVCLPLLAILVATWAGLEIFCGLSAVWRLLFAVAFVVIFSIIHAGTSSEPAPNLMPTVIAMDVTVMVIPIIVLLVQSQRKSISNSERLDKDNMMHRVGGPAVEYANGTKVWMVNGRIHRTDGPAIITYDGLSEWYEHGRQLSIEEVVARNLMEQVIK